MNKIFVLGLIALLICGCTQIGQKADNLVEKAQEKIVPQNKISSIDELASELMKVKPNAVWDTGIFVGGTPKIIGTLNREGKTNVHMVGVFSILLIDNPSQANETVQSLLTQSEENNTVIRTKSGIGWLRGRGTAPMINCRNKYIVWALYLPENIASSTPEQENQWSSDSIEIVSQICNQVA
ncbi:MAG: hypothetical protein NT051_06550 [Candidatus Micrarchaeota archaeon]|nr:hypothetical protein [Candidatus Micrarchaeota archaeon]